MMRRLPCVPLLLLMATSVAHAALHASVDNPQVAPGDTVQLTLTHDGQTHTEPDLAPLKQDFDIVSRSTSTSVQMINGSVSSSTQLALALAPKRSGPLVIPALTWDSDRSVPIAINVGGGSGQHGAGAPTSRLFLETTVDPKSPYVQAAVHVTVKLFIATQLSHANLDFPASDAVAIRQAGPDQNSTTERNGQVYQVVVRHYLLTPQHSGHLVIPGPVLTGEALVSQQSNNANDPFSGFFGNSPFAGMMATRKPVRINGDSIVLDVQPRPSGAGTSYWLPARNVTLTADWSPANGTVHAGDPVTVNLHLQAQDTTSAELPDVTNLLRLPAGLKAYPDEPKLKDTGQGDTVVSERDQSVALIADQPGRFTLPELRLSWWDTQTNQAREAVIPAKTIEVTPAPGSQTTTQTAPPPAVENNTQPSTATSAANHGNPAAPITPAGTDQHGAPAGTTPWPWITLAFGLLWVGTLVAWFISNKRSSGRRPPPPVSGAAPAADASRARGAFQAACRANDALAARRNLIAWANATAPNERIAGLAALSKRIDDANTVRLLRDLDRACYVGGTWDGGALAAALEKLTLRERPEATKKPALAPLYH
jgi:hypothetical protein